VHATASFVCLWRFSATRKVPGLKCVPGPVMNCLLGYTENKGTAAGTVSIASTAENRCTLQGLWINEEELGTKRQRGRPQANGTNRLRRKSYSKKAENWGNWENRDTGTVVRHRLTDSLGSCKTHKYWRCLKQCFSTAGPRPGTGAWQQLSNFKLPEEPAPQYFVQLPDYKVSNFQKNLRLNISFNYQTTRCQISWRTSASIFRATTRLQGVKLPEEPAPQHFVQPPDYKVNNFLKNLRLNISFNY